MRENLPNAQVVFDKFHVIALVNGAVDEVRRAGVPRSRPRAPSGVQG
ncbi:MAG: transposase [Verrucomicrobiia bacterium]